MANLSENEKHNVCQRAIEAKKDIEVKFLALGELLHRIKEGQLYEAGWSSWEEYAEELRMSPASISKLIRIYLVFVVQHEFSAPKLAEAGWSNLAELLPDIEEKTTKQEIGKWVSEASELTLADLRRTIHERRKGVDMIKCKHADTYKIEICRGCGERWGI